MTAATRRVVLAASGALWESAAVRGVEDAPDLALVRRCVDVAELIAVAQAGGVDVAVVDLDVPDLDLDAVRSVQAAGATVVGLGEPDRAQALDVSLVGAGQDVVDAVRSVDVARRAPDPTAADGHAAPRGRLVTVWGPAGAPGRSTLALTLADALGSREHRVALVDADTYGGAQAQLLGLLDEVSGLMASCRSANQGRLDDVADHLQAVRPGLAVLTGVPRADMWVHVRRAALERVVDRLLEAHDTVVADVGFCLEPGEGVAGAGRNQTTAALLERADTVVAVGRADPVGLTRLVRGLHDLRDLGVEDPVVVLNQARPGIAWSAEEVSATVQRLAGATPAVVLPLDADTVDTAVLRGSTPGEVAGSSPFVAGVARLAEVLAVTSAPVVGGGTRW